jgi:D-sedoheptulose 7-phosphate isomerase
MMTDGKGLFRDQIEDHLELVRTFADRYGDHLTEMAAVIERAFREGARLYIFGNGGSAADAQHIAAEFVNKMTAERRPLPAIALTTDTSVLTSIANDISFYDVFSRQLSALGAAGDIALGITTSGNSPNVLRGIEKAAALGMTTFTFLGRDGGRLKGQADYEILIPHRDTPRIQEVHILAGHILCQLVEEKFS